MNVAAILPVYGRHEQTIRNVARLHATAGQASVAWWAVGGENEHQTLRVLRAAGWHHIQAPAPSLTFWEALTAGTEATDAPLIVTLANDLLGGPAWLERAVAAYRARFGEQPGMMGFNGDGHGPEHSCHFLIHRELLASFGGWPVWYRHNYGDTELCIRAAQLGRYAKAPYAILFHDHPWVSAGQDDEVYAAGRAHWAEDQALFEARRARGWQ